MPKYSAEVHVTKETRQINIWNEETGLWAGRGTVVFMKEHDVWWARIADCGADIGEGIYNALDDAITEEMAAWNGEADMRFFVSAEGEEEGEEEEEEEE